MHDSKKEMLEVLRSNRGFPYPEKWIEYGILKRFKKVSAIELNKCPDCSCRFFEKIGQYVYYSTLIALRECDQCGLIFSDKRIDLGVIQSHFEEAYKDERYFVEKRRRIFEQIAKTTDRLAPHGGNVLDIGGAKGHLMAKLFIRRPDLRPIVNDISKQACDYAEEKYGFSTACGGVGRLEDLVEKFDVIVMSDVIYYEPELGRLWEVLQKLVSPTGAIIIRVPNKLWLIRLWQQAIRLFRSRAQMELQDHIRFFNPEHLYAFSQHYLLKRLRGIGFNEVRVLPSHLLSKGRHGFWDSIYFYFCLWLSCASNGLLTLTPSLLIVAKFASSQTDSTALE